MSLLLAALIAVEAARIAVALVSGPVKSPRPVIAASMQSHPPRARGSNAQAVAAAHLFGMAVADPTTQDPSNAPLSQRESGARGHHRDSGSEARNRHHQRRRPLESVYAVGENVNGATLYSVYLDHVILDRGGTLETLLLPSLLAGGPRAHARSGPWRREPPGGRQRHAAWCSRIRASWIRSCAPCPPTTMRPGNCAVFAPTPGGTEAIFNELGLKPGDLVTAINGQPLDDPQHSQEVFNTIQSSNTVTVSVERGGQKQDITLNVAQIAAEASKDLESEHGQPRPAPARGSRAGHFAAGCRSPTNENPNE